ncbi:MAG: multicopper oxidase domain-containing protein [Steroidobacteraceae bacterium]
MRIKTLISSGLTVAAILLYALPASAQSFRVQCPAKTALHPNGSNVDAGHPGQVKCQHIAGGDGFATMGDGHQIYLFGFAPLSGLGDPANAAAKPGILTGKPGTQTPTVFNNQADVQGARIEPAAIMNNGVMYSNAPAPLMAIDEDDELFLTLSNVGQIMRPDLFEQHTVHFHGYPNASSFFDGVPDASVAINIAGSFTYYYTAPDAGTYFWHCHIAPPEHLQMGMVGQIYVRPRQNRVADNASLYTALLNANNANRSKVADTNSATAGSCSDILCTGATPLPAGVTVGTNDAVQPVGGATYAYNDGDGTTRYDYDVPIQMMGFDPNFHFVGMTFNPEAFADMKDKYFLLNGRSYPDTIQTSFDNSATIGIDGATPVPNGPMTTEGSDGYSRPSQPLHSLVTLDKTNGKTRALLRISDLSVTEHSTLATVGIPMQVIAENARLLRDADGNNLYYKTNSVTLGGGESIDVILDATDVPKGTYYLYSTNLDHLSNDAENFGGMMTEVVVK